MFEAVVHNKKQAVHTSRQYASSSFFRPVIQPKLRINEPGDEYEREADNVADQVMRMPDHENIHQPFFRPTLVTVQRKCSQCEEQENELQLKEDEEKSKEEEPLQLKPIADLPVLPKPSPVYRVQEKLFRKETQANTQETPASIEQALNSGGQPMDITTRHFMEERFGYDFSNVQIHNDSQAYQSSDDINALAYTHQNHVVFGAGQYQPGSVQGKQLLAHELTHVVQQTNSPSLKKIQRKPFFFAPPQKPKGTLIHKEVLPLFLAENTDLFIEAPIPGAKKMDVDKEAKGRADFYKADPTNGTSRTIGIKFDGETPEELGASQLKWGGGKYSHSGKSAPQASPDKPRIRKIDDAPVNIFIGDLKPGFSSESFLGQGQVTDYETGIINTAAAINKFLGAKPDEGSPQNAKWNPKPATLAMDIPKSVVFPTGTQFPIVPLALYEEKSSGVKRIMEDTSLRGRLFVYKDTVSGVWSYEWIPVNIPASTGNSLVNSVLDRLNNDVIPAITATSTDTGTVRKKSNPRKKSIAKKAPEGIIQKADKKFNKADWDKKHYSPWKTEAEKFLGNEKEVEKATVAKTLVDVEERSRTDIKLPAEVKERGKGLDKIEHWKRFGGLYGWLRDKFDFVYVKLQKFAGTVKEKIKKFTQSASAVKFANWIKAAASVIFKIFKMVGSWVVSQVLEKLLQSFKEGASNNLKKVVDMFTPEGVKSKIEEFEELKDTYQKIIDEKEDEITKWFFGDNLELFEKAEKFEKAAEEVSDIVTLVEWGIRLLACASPPAIGCLWNLAISALQAAFALLIQTCWFTKEVYAPVINLVKPVKEFPSKVAKEIVETANKYIPVPNGFDPIFAAINIDTSEFKVNCNEASDGGSGLTAERKAILDFRKEIGDEKFRAFLEMMSKRAAGPWSLVTAERLKAVKDILADITADELRSMGDDPANDPETLKDFTKDISQYTGKEIKVKKDFFEAKKNREEIAKEKAEDEKKIKEAIKEPYPSYDELKKDLEKFNWSALSPNDSAFAQVNKRFLIVIKTGNGARMGAYLKYIEKSYKGENRLVSVDTSEFINLDTIVAGDGFFTPTGTVDQGDGKTPLYVGGIVHLSGDAPVLSHYDFRDSFVRFYFR